MLCVRITKLWYLLCFFFRSVNNFMMTGQKVSTSYITTVVILMCAPVHENVHKIDLAAALLAFIRFFLLWVVWLFLSFLKLQL